MCLCSRDFCKIKLICGVLLKIMLLFWCINFIFVFFKIMYKILYLLLECCNIIKKKFYNVIFEFIKLKVIFVSELLIFFFEIIFCIFFN